MSDEPMDSLDQESEEIRRVGTPGGKSHLNLVS